MPDASHLLLFVLAGLALNFTPGPDMLYVTSSALRSGMRAGWAATLGVSLGCMVHVTAAALGLAALIAASQTVFGLLKWVGAAYLAWVGIQKLRSAFWPRTETAPTAAGTPALVGHAHDGSRRAAFRGGFLTCALNPKVAIFFLAFVPQFITPGDTHPALVFLALGALFTLNSTWVNALWAAGAAWLASRGNLLRRVTRWLDGVAGGIFVAFAAELALSDAPGMGR